MGDHMEIARDALTLASETTSAEVERTALARSQAAATLAIAEALERNQAAQVAPVADRSVSHAAPSLVALDAAEEALTGLLSWRAADLLTGTATDDAILQLRGLADRLSALVGGGRYPAGTDALMPRDLPAATR